MKKRKRLVFNLKFLIFNEALRKFSILNEKNMRNLERIPQENVNSEIENLKKKLRELRDSKEDIYRIARTLQMLRLRGEYIEPTQEEEQEIIDNLEKARAGKSERPLAPGYEIARWLMIGRELNIESIAPTEQDQDMIEKALQKYKQEKNFRQLASLIKTVEFLGIPLDIGDLNEEDRGALEKELEMQNESQKA